MQQISEFLVTSFCCLATTGNSSASSGHSDPVTPLLLGISIILLAAKFGGTLKEIYWTVGPYDIVAISEAPDDESATAFALTLASQGNVRTTTLRAFSGDEMRGVIAKTE